MDRSLYVPMFFFFSILASADFILCITCVPKTLGILWLKAQIIIISYLPHPVVFSPLRVLLDSAIVLGMAFDHYMVICSPLRYTLVSDTWNDFKIMVGIFGQSFSTILLVVFLVMCLPFCRKLIISHTYCEQIGVVRLASADISINIWYGFAVPIMTVILDLILIGISYTLILHAVFYLPPRDTHQKAFSTHSSHISVILIFYTPAMFSVLTHCFGHNISHTFHITSAILYVATPPAHNPSCTYKNKTDWGQDPPSNSFLKGCSDLGMRTWRKRLWEINNHIDLIEFLM
ncbi:LOW QUALITY PROTEIN: olfactory receptor 52H1-like [Rhinolophus ferrumequinum]|uniref:LOW QUALITY PROTEIN: olfactory receptor 52H1-like n=1 Tax=Rhinolophus ferrumequinum TaxID=59479 RepID=UPI00140F9BC9|nr:LOW QUALITY PROTEIN: olfactory receptor 52H1-like [Rhinolophus ferrumequinum]